MGLEFNNISGTTDFRNPCPGNEGLVSRSTVNKVGAQTFQNFLNQTAEKALETKSSGFTWIDKLKYRYVDYLEAKGVAKLGKLLTLGGLGYLFIGNLTNEELTLERNFYRAVCKAKASFHTFETANSIPIPKGCKWLAKSVARKFQVASQDFIDLLQFGDVVRINDIMNNATGCQVPNILNKYIFSQPPLTIIFLLNTGFEHAF
ncbi:MAG: hypothetical protein KBA81_06740 [Rhabdochlamydiaceae bacterium]|nr:hypothetical protein [Rhabdochlamydiaceae bacterium]